MSQTLFRFPFTEIADIIPHLLWSTQASGYCDFYNERWYNYTGATFEDHKGWGWQQSLFPDDRERVRVAWSQALEQGETYEVEYRLRGADGVYRWFLARGTPLRDEDGKVIRWWGTSTDIDAQKQQEDFQRFLATHDEQVRAVAAPEDILWITVKLLGNHLQVARCTFNEIDVDNDLVTVHRDYSPGMPSLTGQFRLSDFGDTVPFLLAGNSVVIEDTATHPLTRRSYPTTYEPLQVRSVLVVPLIKEGKVISTLSVNDTVPRQWTDSEEQLIARVSEHTWLALENTRLYRAAQEEVEQRRQTEALLREKQSQLARSEQQFRAAAEGSFDAFFILNSVRNEQGSITDFVFVEVNTNGEKLLGMSRERLIGNNLCELLPMNRTGGFFDKYCEVVEQNRPVEEEFGNCGAGHTDIWLRQQVVPLGDGIAITTRDITERKQTELALQEEVRLTENLHRVGGVLTAELDMERLLQRITDEATRLCGAQFGSFFYNVVDSRGERFTLYTISGVPREAFSKFPMSRNTEVFAPTFYGQGTVRSADITRDPRYGKNAPHRGMPPGHLPVRSYLAVPVKSSSGEVLGGLFFGHSESGVFSERHERLLVGVAAHAGIALDNARLYRQAQNEIAVRKQAEAALGESEERLRIALSAAGLGYWSWDTKTDSLFFSTRSYEIFQLAPDTSLTFTRFLETVAPTDRQRVQDAVLRSIRERREYNIEYCILGQGGTERWVAAMGNTLYADDGAPMRMMGVVQDITERKESEREREQHLQEIEALNVRL